MTDVGFVTGPIGGYAEPQDTNLSEVPSTNWEAGGDWFEGIKRLGRATQRGQMEQDLSPIPEPPQTGGGFLDAPGNLGPGFGGQGDPGQDKTFGTQSQIQQRQNDTLTKDDANGQFGIEGELAFDGPVLKGVAQNLYDAKREELMRRSMAERAPPGFFNGLSRFGANFVKQFLDPLNVAASFIPVVGEARYAEWLAEAGGAAARAGIRAGVGTAAGAVGQIPLSGIQYALSKSEQADYSAVQALTDIATGALIGGVLHIGGGFVKDHITGEYRAATPAETRATAEVTTLPQAIHEAPAQTHETALRSAIAAVVEDRQVEVAPLFEAADTASPRIPDIVKTAPGHVVGPGAMFSDPNHLPSFEDIDAMISEKGMSDRAKLLQALGSEERVKRFNKLDRDQNSSNTDRADLAAEQMRQEFGDLTPAQQRLVYGIGETNYQADELKDIRRAMEDTSAIDTPTQAADQVTEALRNLGRTGKGKDIFGALRGERGATAQADALRFVRAFAALRKTMPNKAAADAELLAAFRRAGFTPGDAEEMLASYMGDIAQGRAAVPERMQIASDRATAPPMGRPGDPLPDRADAASQRAAAEVLAKPEPKDPVKAIEEKALEADAAAATLEASVKAGTLPAEDLASLKAADEIIAHADTLEKAYAAAADCPALKGS